MDGAIYAGRNGEPSHKEAHSKATKLHSSIHDNPKGTRGIGKRLYDIREVVVVQPCVPVVERVTPKTQKGNWNKPEEQVAQVHILAEAGVPCVVLRFI